MRDNAASTAAACWPPGCCARGWLPASPVVCPCGVTCAKGDAELDVVRLKPKLLHPATQAAQGSITKVHCTARCSKWCCTAFLATSANQLVGRQQAGCRQPCFALPHAHAPIHLEEEEVVAV
jgi:hypothetical protein